jgi:carbonic anhydrase/acetyltransferase-like protein (isoleucine patch superfamily)
MPASTQPQLIRPGSGERLNSGSDLPAARPVTADDLQRAPPPAAFTSPAGSDPDRTAYFEAPPGAVIPAGSVLVGRPPHVIRSATDADRERLAVLRQHQTNLTDYPGTIVSGPMRAGERMGTLYAYRDKTPSIGAGTVLFDSAEITGDVVIGKDTLIGAGVKIIGDSHGPVRIGSRVQILENTVLHLLPDNELIIDDDAVIGPGAMIHGCHIGRGSIVEPGAIVCDGSVVGAESVVCAGACVKQRDRFGDRSILDGFPARLASTLAGPPPMPSWALPPDAVATLRRVQR